MVNIGLVRRVVLAGAVALSLTGLTSGLDSAVAMPAAPLPADTATGAAIAVQYYGDAYGYRRAYRRPAYGYGYRYRGRAGLYRCGPYAQHTHLQRRACR